MDELAERKSDANHVGIIFAKSGYGLADNMCMVSPAQSRLIQAELAPAAVNTQISSAIAAKSLDAEKQQGAAVLRLLDGAIEVPADPNGLGSTLDVMA